MIRVHGGLALVAALVMMTSCGPAGDEALLAASWATFRAVFITIEGRVVRPENGGDTVSEGQAYALLRAAWMDDRATFDRVWQWTDSRLRRRGRQWPALFAWTWSPDAGVTDWNVASDADADIALALLVAAGRWPVADSAYRASAQAILADLIDHARAVDDEGLAVFLPGRWADQRAEGRGLVLNPSYFAPASFRAFHRATGDLRWLELADGAYTVLEATCGTGPGSLPPDWIRWSASMHWAPDEGTRGLPGWDAVRVPWRIATDALWWNESKASAYLSRCLEPRVRAALGGGLAVEYDAAGRARGGTDHPLANALYAFALTRPAERDALLARVEQQVTRQGQALFFGERGRYYVNSLAYLPFLARAGGYRAP